MSNNHNINLLFSDFSFNFLVTFTRFCHSIDFLNLLIRKSYNYEVIKKKIQIVVRNSFGSGSGTGSGSGLRFLAGSGFNEYGSETLA